VTYPCATSDTVKPLLDALTKEWEKTDKSAQLVLAQSKNLIDSPRRYA